MSALGSPNGTVLVDGSHLPECQDHLNVALGSRDWLDAGNPNRKRVERVLGVLERHDALLIHSPCPHRKTQGNRSMP